MQQDVSVTIAAGLQLPSIRLVHEAFGILLVKRVPIKRKSNVSQVDFARDHLSSQGVPVLITDATEHWPARSKWTFDFFRTTYGSDLARAWLELMGVVSKVTTLASYINFLDAPAAELPGLWVGRDGRPLRVPPEPGGSPLYLLGWKAFDYHPELYSDITPAPYFVLDWVSALTPTLRKVLERASGRDYTAVYLGPAGSLSPLHQDFAYTHAYLAQIQGRKRAVLFSPQDSNFLYRGKVNPEEPDSGRFPLFDQATAYECVISPGETLFIPAGWWHYVRGLEKSITVSHNFFNDVNFTDYMLSILQNIPSLMESLEKSPEWREELRTKWGPGLLARFR